MNVRNIENFDEIFHQLTDYINPENKFQISSRN